MKKVAEQEKKTGLQMSLVQQTTAAKLLILKVKENERKVMNNVQQGEAGAAHTELLIIPKGRQTRRRGDAWLENVSRCEH